MQPSSRQPARQPARGRRGLAVALVAAALPLLSGCAANFDSPVLQDYNPSPGVNVRAGGVWGMNLLVLLDESGHGTLVGALVNKTQRTDRLVGATLQADQGGGPLRTSLRRQLTLRPGQLAELSDPPTVAVKGEVRAGLFVRLTLQFQRARPIEVEVPVKEPEGPYAEVQLPGAAAERTSPSPTPTDTATGSPADGASPTEPPAH